MRRRTFLLSAAACAVPSLSAAYPAQMYTPAVWRDLRQTDQTVVMNFRASWSLTCQIKSDLIAEAGLGATPHVLRGGIGEQALLLAEALKARLMIVNATRQDSAHTTLGTHAAQIARHAPCSVLLVRA